MMKVRIFSSDSNSLIAVLVIIMLFAAAFEIYPQETRQLEREKTTDRSLEKRLALVIGNGDYWKARKLLNPVNDANDMAETLQAVGFEVISGTDLNLKEMNDKIREFGDRLKVNGGTGLFYYAGHGIQVSGRNYLIPIEAEIPREDEVDFNAVNLDLVLRKMATANNGLNIVILDACRNNPFARSWSRGDDEGGLAQITAPTGTFIAYSTSPDRTASDGEGRNGLYTAELLKVMPNPNFKIEEAFKQVTIAVDRESGGKQVPWTSSSLRGEFYFKLNEANIKITSEANVSTAKLSETKSVPQNTAGSVSAETADWNRIKNSQNPLEFSVFVQKYPRGQYTQQAMSRMLQLSNVEGLDEGEIPTASAIFLLDGENRVQMKTALTKQDYNTNMGVMGIGASVKYMTAFNGARSQLRTKNSKPEFEYLLTNQSLNMSDVVFVVKLKSKSDTREIQGMQKTFSGFKKEDMVSVVFEEIPSPNVGKLYKIKFSNPLPAGEYAVVINETNAGFGSMRGIQMPGIFFDFGIDRQ